jgi:hypothetical protein
VSTDSIDIVKGDSEFNLIAQMIDCARGVKSNSRQPFMLTLEGPLDVFVGDGAKTNVSSEIATLIMGIDSEGYSGDKWRIRGYILDEVFVDRPALRAFESFRANYDTRTRSGFIEPY